MLICAGFLPSGESLMALSLASRADLTLANFRRVAWQGEAARFAPAALARMTASRRQFLDLLESDPELTIYGVTSGYGQHANKRLSGEERKHHARRPPHGPAVAFGPSLPERVVRGIVFARLANYVEGHAAASAELATAVAAMLDGECLPKVSLAGQGGAGEVTALAPVSYRILPRVLAQFRRAVEAAEVAAETSLKAITDNPVFLAPSPGHPKARVYSTGGYHNAMAHPAMDNLAAATADLCLLTDRH